MQAPRASCPTLRRYMVSHRVALLGTAGIPCIQRCSISATGTRTSHRRAFKSIRTMSRVRTQASPPPRLTLERCADYGRTVQSPRLPSISDGREARSSVSRQGVPRLHVHDFRGSGATQWRRNPNHENARLVDVQRRIIDTRVIILRSVEHDCATSKHSFPPRRLEIPLAKLVRNDTCLHQGGLEEIAAKNQQAAWFRSDLSKDLMSLRFVP